MDENLTDNTVQENSQHFWENYERSVKTWQNSYKQ